MGFQISEMSTRMIAISATATEQKSVVISSPLVLVKNMILFLRDRLDLK